MSVQRIEQESRTARIELRVVPSEKETVELAAKLSGCNTSEFTRYATLEAAQRTIEELLPIELSKLDFETVLNLDSQNRQPNEALVAAASRYKKRTGR